ncbi:MAG TPA: tRNA modification GTPase [Gemmataceae bacterium]|jgi:tRNA modification GTPase|nr:tRNA modification GTPase [Gemmataceae bacterium]
MLADPNDTILALASAAGPGARAIVRLSGPQSLEIVRSVFTTSEHIDPQCRRMCAGEIQLTGVASSLPGWLYHFPVPHTYTGQAMVELHTISSPPLIELLIAQLLEAGARAAQPGEFTLRAFLAGKRDLPRAEAVHAVISAGNRDELTGALAQLAGGVTRPLEGLRDDLLNLLADVEAQLDFTEEGLEFVGIKETLLRLSKGMAQLTTLQRQLERRSTGERPFRAVLVGEPNAGKSSLFNALGGAALVSPQPGTTRDYLVARIELDGVTVELVDTAGWQDAGDEIGRQAQSLGRSQSHDADLLLLCVEARRPSPPGPVSHAVGEGESSAPPLPLSHAVGEGETFAPPLPQLRERGPGGEGVPILSLATKCDLAEPAAGMLATSAVSGLGLPELRARIAGIAKARRQPSLAPSLSRCRHHVAVSLEHLRKAHSIVLFEEPPELLALELRGALQQLGEMVGAIYTEDLLDRIFSRFCIGK